LGHLNIATGFLFSIVAGNGINFGIIFLGRYFEELRGGSGNEASIRVAIRTTWKATLTAALAAAAAYASLWVSEFRGLKHFAVIGALGMPALLARHLFAVAQRARLARPSGPE
jgi:hypothetical protein